MLTRLLAGAAFGLAVASQALHPLSANALDMPNLWVARFSTYKGDLTCTYGSQFCNRCVNSVEQQFRALTSGSGRMRHWITTSASTAPVGEPPLIHDAVDPPKDSQHWQGFVRAATDTLPSGIPSFFGSVGSVNGGIFALDRSINTSSPRNPSVLFLYDTISDHAGGMQAVGRQLMIAHDNPPVFQRIDAATMPVHPGEIVPLEPLVTDIANLSAAKVAGGGYVFAVTPNSKHSNIQLLYTPSLSGVRFEKAHDETLLLSWHPSVPNAGAIDSWSYGYENLSMVTECGTGDLYVIGASAPEFASFDNGTYLGGKAIWGLYKIEPSVDHHPQLTLLATNSARMYSKACDPRGAASAFAGINGELALYCHQKGRDPNTRRNGVLCGIGGIAAGLMAPAVKSICQNNAGTNERLFTEFIAEAPSGSTVPVIVTIKNLLPTRLSTHSDWMGVMSGDGRQCEVTTGQNEVVCTWHIPVNTDLALVPFRDPETTNMSKWTEGGCPQDGEGWADGCVKRITGPARFTLEGSGPPNVE